MSQFKPTSNYILVKPFEAPDTTKSGIYIPTHKSQTIQRGVAVSVGAGAVTMSGSLIPMEVSEGVVVVFKSVDGVEIELNGEKHLLLRETDIMGLMS
jgi:chaperonin GroES